MPTYLERYLQGEHEQVWAELQAMGERVPDEPVYSDAVAVARETMRRVRSNVELLIPRLETLGYYFHADHEENREAHDPPKLASPHEQTRAQLDEIERGSGPLPISLRAFYEVVGAVNLVGEPPRPESEDAEFLDLADSEYEGDGWVGGTRLDPLYIYGLQTNYERWQQARDDAARRATYRALLFPDFYLKYGIGGVGPISIKAPSATMDAPLMFEGGALISPQGGEFLFGGYLRFALARGGFPGLSGEDVDTSPIASDLLARLVEGFQPF
jgi:hypothetical protein